MENGNRVNNSAARPKGGLYAKVKMSVKSANIMVGCLALLLCIALVFVVKHNGFTVKFDTDGGSYMQPVKAMYSETLSAETPVKEGYEFTGWYTDRACTAKWNADDGVTGSMTLYAGWDKKE